MGGYRIPLDKVEFIRDNFNKLNNVELQEATGLSRESVRGIYRRLGFRRSKGDGRFIKGQAPANKGKPMSPETYKKCKGTMFGKGNLPHNTRKDGDFSDRLDTRTGLTYRYFRIKMSVWVLYHRYLWEQAYGEIPKDHIIKFKDGDTLNLSLDNLTPITRAEHATINSGHHYPPEVQQAVRALNKLKKTIKSKNDGKEQNDGRKG